MLAVAVAVACCLLHATPPAAATAAAAHLSGDHAVPCCQLFLRFIKIVINWHLNAQTQNLRDVVRDGDGDRDWERETGRARGRQCDEADGDVALFAVAVDAVPRCSMLLLLLLSQLLLSSVLWNLSFLAVVVAVVAVVVAVAVAVRCMLTFASLVMNATAASDCCRG